MDFRYISVLYFFLFGIISIGFAFKDKNIFVLLFGILLTVIGGIVLGMIIMTPQLAVR